MATKICTQTEVIPVDNSVIKCEQPISTDCVIHEAAIAYLSLPVNSTTTEVIGALILSLTDARSRIAALETYNTTNP